MSLSWSRAVQKYVFRLFQHLTNDPNFDHSEVEKASVKLVNGNQTAQSLMDGEHFSRR